MRITDKTKRHVASALYIIGIIIAVIPHFIFLKIPVGSADGNWVFWRSGKLAISFYILFMFIAGWMFTYINLEAFSKLLSPLLKARVILYALAGFILPFSAFYFGATSPKEIYLSFLLSISGMFLFIIGNIVIGALLKRNPKNLIITKSSR